MSHDITASHLDAIEAELKIALLRVEQARQYLASLQPVKAAKRSETPRPDRCTNVPDGKCALRNDEAALPRASFGNPHGWQCAGCRYEGARAAMA